MPHRRFEYIAISKLTKLINLKSKNDLKISEADKGSDVKTSTNQYNILYI